MGAHLSRAWLAWATVLLCVALLLPLIVVDLPPLLDYPNHLARAMVLAFGATDPVVSHMYAAHWAIIPNLGLDLILPPLLHILPLYAAGRVVLGIVILLPVLGTIAYARAAFGRWSAWPLASGLVAYNAAFLLGFLNFVAAIGLALLFAAGWITWRERYPISTILLSIAGCIVLFFCHLTGLLFLYILISGNELDWLWSHREEPASLLKRLLALLPLLAVPATLYLLSPLASVQPETEFASPADKLRELIFPFANSLLPLDLITAGFVLAVLLACAGTGRCQMTKRTALVTGSVGVLYLLSPWSFKETYFVDIRFVIMLGFLLFGAMLPSGLPRRTRLALGTAVALLLVLRIAVVAFAWDGHRHDLAAVRAAIAGIEPGTRVFVSSVSPDEAPQYWREGLISRRLSNGIRVDYHLAALLLIEHRAFWPFLFDNPSQQPIITLEPYRTLARQVGSLPDHLAIAEPTLCGYDELLLLEAGADPNLTQFAADRFTPVARSDFAALFQIKDSSCASASRHENPQSPLPGRGSTDRSGWPKFR